MTRTRSIVYATLIVLVTATSYFAISGWRDAILGGGIALLSWLIASRTFLRLKRFKPARVSVFDRALRAREPYPEKPADLEAIERLFGWRTYAPDEFDSRIRPFIERLVTRRLLDHHGVDLRTDPQRATEVMGPQLQELLIERREMPSSTQHITLLIDEVEAL